MNKRCIVWRHAAEYLFNLLVRVNCYDNLNLRALYLPVLLIVRLGRVVDVKRNRRHWQYYQARCWASHCRSIRLKRRDIAIQGVDRGEHYGPSRRALFVTLYTCRSWRRSSQNHRMLSPPSNSGRKHGNLGNTWVLLRYPWILHATADGIAQKRDPHKFMEVRVTVSYLMRPNEAWKRENIDQAET